MSAHPAIDRTVPIDFDWTGALPVLSGTKTRKGNLHPRGVIGTISAVTWNNNYVLITAHHMFRKNVELWKYVPILPDGKFMYLDEFIWMSVEGSGEMYGPDGFFDLCYSILTKDQVNNVDTSIFRPLGQSIGLKSKFTGLLAGYLAKDNRPVNIENRGSVQPQLLEVWVDGIHPKLKAPYLEPKYDGRFSVDMPRQDVLHWKENSYVELQTAPVPRGLSGGPLIFKGFSNPMYEPMESQNQLNTVIGFFIEHDKKSIGTFIMSEVIAGLLEK